MPSPINMADFEEVPPAPTGGPVNLSDYEDVSEAAPRKDALGNELKHGAAQTFARSALDTMTLGHHDEISGWIDAALQGHPFDSETYRRERDKYRAEMKQGDEEHPVAHYAGAATGAVASSFIPGLNVAKGAGLGATALKLGAIGGVAGLGASEADLTKGEFHKAALDTAFGAGVGAVTGIAGKKLADWIGNAPVRDEARQLAGLKEGVQYSTKLKAFGKATPSAPEGQFTAAIKGALKEEPAIRTAITKEPGKALQLVDAHVGNLTEQLDSIYAKAQDATPGVPMTKVLRQLHRVEMDFEKTSATKPLAKQVAGVIDDLRETWQGQNVVKQVGHMPLQSLREEYRAWQDIANKSAKLFAGKSPREEVSEAMANAMREALQDHVETVATRNPSLGISRKLLQDTNQKVSTWLKVQNVLTEKVSRSNVGAPPMGELINAVTTAAKHPLATAAKLVVPSIEHIADPRLASLARAAAAGDQRAAQLLQIFQRAPTRGAVSAGAGAGVAIRPAFVDNPEDSGEAVASQ